MTENQARGRSRGVAVCGGRWLGIALIAVGLLCGATPPPARAVQVCTQNCAEVALGGASGYPGGLVAVPVTFTQGPDDGQAGRGIDDIAALAFSIGLPSSGPDPALTLGDCDDANGDGVPDVVSLDSSIRDSFRVVIENWLCTNRNRCLCPGPGQTTDHFVNVVVYGPKDLPAQGSVTIPTLPKGPQRLFSLSLRVAKSVQAGSMLPLHLYAETDTPKTKPEFTAFLSVGDKAAVDQTCVGNCVDGQTPDTSKVRTTDATVSVAAGFCVGDCNANHVVTVDELLTGVKVALGGAALSKCTKIDASQDGAVTVEELVAAVNNAVHGCP